MQTRAAQSAALSLLIALVAAGVARAHPADEMAPRIELSIEITDDHIAYTAYIPASVGFDEILPVDSLDEYRSTDIDDLADPIAGYFAENHPVEIDGLPVRPVLEDIKLNVPPATVSGDNTGRRRQRQRRRPQQGRSGNEATESEPAPEEAAAEGTAEDEEPAVEEESEAERARRLGLFGIELRYETKGRPRRVSIVWNRYLDPTPPPAASNDESADSRTGAADPAGASATGPSPQDRSASDGPAAAGTDADTNGEDASQDTRKQPVLAVLLEGRRGKIITFRPDEPQYVWHADEAAPVPAGLTEAPEPQPVTLQLPAASLALAAASAVGLLGLWLRGVRPAVRWGLPVVGLVLAAALTPVAHLTVELPWKRRLEPPTPRRATTLFETLLRNVYRAFDYDSDEAIYDTLARSVAGRELEKIYNDVYQSLILRDEGGAVARVQRVEVLEAELIEGEAPDFREASADAPDTAADDPDTPDAFQVRGRWRVHGIVRHWGHTHRRVNEFEARYTIAPRAGRWKIIETEILQQQRVPEAEQAHAPATTETSDAAPTGAADANPAITSTTS